MNKQGKQLKLVVKNGGEINVIYDDALIGLMDGAEIEIKRASHVEPDWFGHECKWIADMRPVNGPILTGFTTRKEALDAEVQYINRHVIK